jgi:hypothetical protein
MKFKCQVCGCEALGESKEQGSNVGRAEHASLQKKVHDSVMKETANHELEPCVALTLDVTSEGDML